MEFPIDAPSDHVFDRPVDATADAAIDSPPAMKVMRTESGLERLREHSREASNSSRGLEAVMNILTERVMELAYGHSLALTEALPAGVTTLEQYQEMTPHIRMSLKLTDQATKMAQFSHRLATERKVFEQESAAPKLSGPSIGGVSENLSD